MSRAASQRLAALLAQRHFRASGIVLKSKHPAPPPPAYGSSGGQHPKVPKDPSMTPTAAGPGASSQAASKSTGGVPPTTGPPFSGQGPTATVASKPPQAADISPGSIGSHSKAANAPAQKGQVKGAEPSGGSAQSQPTSPLQKSSSLQKSLSQDGAIPVSRTAAPSGASTHGPTITAAPQPVRAAPEPSAAQSRAAPAQKPPPSAQGNAQTHGAEAGAPGTSLPLHPTVAAGPPPAGGKAPQKYYKGDSAVTRAASGSGIGSSAAGKPPQGNAWLLSKAIPVDVRLLAGGAASIGALYYYSTRDAKKPQGPGGPALPEESELGFAPPMQPQEDAPDEPETAPLQQWEVLGDMPENSVDEQPEQHAQKATTEDGPAGEEDFVQDGVLAGPAAEHAADEHPPSSSGSPGDFYTDELAMGSQQHDAKHASEKQEEDATQPAEHVDGGGRTPSKEKSTLAQTLEEGISSAAKAVEHSIKHGQPLDFVDTRPVTDLLNDVGSGDLSTLDPSISGTFDKGRAEQQVGAARAEVDALKGTAYVLRTHITTVQDLLGISEDLSAEGLLVKAIERGEIDGSDWHASKESLLQARADEKTIQEVLGEIYAKQQGRFSAALGVAEANADRAEQIEREAANAQLQFAKILEETLHASERQREHDLKQQETILAAAAAEHAAQERQSRLEALNEVRKYVNALGAAFSRRSDEAQASTLAHQLSLGVFALEDALAHGRPYAAAASQLARSAPQDELVASACWALPQDAADRGIPTVPELLKRAAALDRTIRPMAYLEPNKGGIVSLGLARLAAALKIQETAIGGAGKHPGTVDEALACMQDCLAQGQLASAAAAIEEGTRGTAALNAAKAWAQDARSRALADQTIALLQAHACSLAASQA